ncbi:MAG: trigger factor [Ferruginibacter sp.]
MATVIRKNIGLLNDKLIVKIQKDDYLPSFEKKLKEYSKTANIPGFRKGMVPAGMIKKMYGSSIFSDEILRGVEKELYNYLNTEKPEIFAQPLPLESDMGKIDINNPSDYEFGFEIGLKPIFELPDFSKAGLTRYKVDVTEEMISEEVNRLQIKAGKMTEPETIDNEENVINVLFTESDESGIPVENGISKENSVLLKYFSDPLQKQLKGKKAGDSFIFKLNEAFSGDKLEIILQDLGFEKNDTASAEKYFKLEVVIVGLVEKREMNEEFFKEVYPGKTINNESELRDTLKNEIQQYWDVQSSNQLHDQLYHFMLDETKMDFPADFLKRWLQTSGEKPKTAEEAEKEYPGFNGQLKWTLISDRIMRDNKLEVNNEELREYMKGEVMRYFGTMDMGEDMSWLDAYMDRMMKDEKQVDATYRRLVTEKLFAFVESKTNPVEKNVTAEELTAMQHNHKH